MNINSKYFLISINLIKLPFLLLIYLFLMLLSFIIPSKFAYRMINITNIEENITKIFAKKLQVKLFAILITVVIFVFFKLSYLEV